MFDGLESKVLRYTKTINTIYEDFYENIFLVFVNSLYQFVYFLVLSIKSLPKDESILWINIKTSTSGYVSNLDGKLTQLTTDIVSSEVTATDDKSWCFIREKDEDEDV